MAEVLREEFAVVEQKIVQFYDEVIEPRLATLDTEQLRLLRDELVARLARVEERINDFKITVSQKWIGKT